MIATYANRQRVAQETIKKQNHQEVSGPEAPARPPRRRPAQSITITSPPASPAAPAPGAAAPSAGARAARRRAAAAALEPLAPSCRTGGAPPGRFHHPRSARRTAGLPFEPFPRALAGPPSGLRGRGRRRRRRLARRVVVRLRFARAHVRLRPCSAAPRRPTRRCRERRVTASRGGARAPRRRLRPALARAAPRVAPPLPRPPSRAQ